MLKANKMQLTVLILHLYWKYIGLTAFKMEEKTLPSCFVVHVKGCASNRIVHYFGSNVSGTVDANQIKLSNHYYYYPIILDYLRFSNNWLQGENCN